MTLSIGSASTRILPQACRELFANDANSDAAAQQLLSLIAEGKLDPGGVMVASETGVIRGVMLALRGGGALAAVWPPIATDREVEDALVRAALNWIHREPTKVVQAIVPDEELARAEALVRAGFRPITQLAFLARSIGSGSLPFTPRRLSFEPVDPDNKEFAKTLMQTYIDTLDVPELNGLRTAEEVMCGYRQSQESGTCGCWLIHEDNAAVGVLVLTRQSDDSTVELTYLGLLPATRGSGRGGEAVEFALDQARQAGDRRVVLSVDVRNRPAIRLYFDRGFHQEDVRTAYLLAGG